VAISAGYFVSGASYDGNVNARLLFISLLHSRVAVGLLMLAAVLLAGTLAFVAVEGWPVGDAFFMALTTVTTVGYGEVRPLDTSGRVIASLLILFGVGLAFYIFTAMVAAIIEGDLQELFGLRRMRTMIEHMHEHHIVCGFGRVGEEISGEMGAHKARFVVVDQDEQSLERARALGVLTVQGDATTEDTLRRAGIGRARAVIAATESDVANTYITLTARGLRPDVFIVARVSTPDLASKLRQAGANRVISPYSIGGRRMALAALQPIMTDFFDIVSAASADERILAEFSVDGGSGLAGRVLSEALEGCKNVVVLAVRNAADQITVAPPLTTRLLAGDRLTLIGDEDELSRIGAVSRA